MADWISQASARQTEQKQSTDIVQMGSAPSVVSVGGNQDGDTPALIASGGSAAQFGWEEFIYGKIRNPHTRAAYGHAVRKFLAYCECLDKTLSQIAPRNVGDYLDHLDYAPATKKLHLSAIRHFFDTLVTRHAVILNPAASVRAERLEVVEGKTPEISIQQCRRLLASINTATVVGLRDKATIGILIYTAARVGAVAKLSRCDFYDTGDQYCLRFSEKGGKSREIPVRHDLRQFIARYIEAGRLECSEKSSPLFRTTVRRTKLLTQNGMTAGDMSRMVKRRMKNVGLPSRFSSHSFRVTTLTDLLTQGVAVDAVQKLAGHADPRTTQLYDRRHRKVTRNIVERISI